MTAFTPPGPHDLPAPPVGASRVGAKAARIDATPLRLQSRMLRGSALAFVLCAIACGSTAGTTPAAPPPEPPPPPAEHVPPPAEEEESDAPKVTILAEVGFATPESVYFDKTRDQYLVSNINGAPLDVDGNGFISKLTYDENGDFELDLKFIDGAAEGVTLNAPKGLTVAGDTLYVADIDAVRRFDALTGEPKGSIKVPGATFVNGLATGKDDVVYVSDSGLDPNFASTGTDAIYTLKGKKLKKLIAGKELGSPNGLVAGEGGVWVTSFGSGELYWVSDAGKRSAVRKLPAGQGDGLVLTKDQRLLVSSWESETVYVGTPEGELSAEISGVASPADIGFDCTRNLVLIPLFTKDSVVIHELTKAKTTAPPEDAEAAEAASPPDEVLPVEEVTD